MNFLALVLVNCGNGSDYSRVLCLCEGIEAKRLIGRVKFYCQGYYTEQLISVRWPQKDILPAF